VYVVQCAKRTRTPERLQVAAEEQAHARHGNIHAPMTVTVNADTGKGHKANSLSPRLLFLFLLHHQQNTITIMIVPIIATTTTAKGTVRPMPMAVQKEVGE